MALSGPFRTSSSDAIKIVRCAACNKGWWNCGDSDSSICRFDLRGVDNLLVRCFKEVKFEMVFGQLIGATQEICDVRNSASNRIGPL